MDQASFLKLMQFPPEWLDWALLPDALSSIQLAGYQPGHEDASEHDRHGAFQWWLRGSPDPEVLVQLVRLSWLDPDLPMAESVRSSIARHPNCNAEVLEAISTPYRRA